MFQLSDLRYALRLLFRTPRFTLLTVLVLGGGLALAIFTFSFLYTAMLRPLPLPGGQDIVRVEQRVNGNTRSLDAADVALMRPSVRTLASLGAFTSRSYIVGDDHRRHVLEATVTEWNIFEVTGARPVMGRGLSPDDQLAGAEPVIVLGHRTWEVLFGSDPNIVDRRITLNGARTRVVGVMPPGYAFPVATDSWVPMSRAQLSPEQPGTSFVNLYARLATGVSAQQAQAELDALLLRAKRTYEKESTPGQVVSTAVRPFPMAQFDDQGPLLLTVLNALAALILLLACINVTNLLLARANERAREVAVRMALGATRARLIMQNMWESVLLCLFGGALAIALAAWGLGFINTWAQNNLEGNLAFWWVWRLERASLIAAGIFITATMALLSAVVALRTTGTRFTSMLRDASARSGGRREGRVSRALVVTQVATVSVLMLVGVLSGLVAQRVVQLDFGFDTNRLLSTAVDLPSDAYDSAERRAQFYRTLSASLNDGVALESALFRAGLADIEDDDAAFEVEGVAAPAALRPRSHVQAVQGPLETLGIALRSGRFFDARDDERGVAVAVVSSSFAARHFAGRAAIGQRIRLSGLNAQEWRTVIGVSSDVEQGSPFARRRSTDAIYIPLAQATAAQPTLFLKHRGDAVAAQAAFYQALLAADPRITPPSISTFEEMLTKSTLLARSTAKLFALCFGFALLLAVSGTYGLMARSIGRRTREIGIRQALGASERSVARMLLGQGGRQLGLGVLIAAPVMALVGFAFSHFLPISLVESLGSSVLVGATIVGVILLATWVPTRRVLRIGAQAALWRD